MSVAQALDFLFSSYMNEKGDIEFKSSFDEGVIETLTAFANTKGGRILVGVDDKGEPIKNLTNHRLSASEISDVYLLVMQYSWDSYLYDTVNLADKILGMLKKEPDITQLALSEALSVSRITIVREIKKLQENEIIRRVGSDKSGYWEICSPSLV